MYVLRLARQFLHTYMYIHVHVLHSVALIVCISLVARLGAFFFVMMNQVFANMSAIELFIKEREIFV